MPHRPIIAVSAGAATIGGITRARLNVAYAAALHAAGAIPVILPILPPDAAADALAVAAGLVLTGGEDVDPARYGQTPHANTEPPDSARDAWEIALLAEARDRALPTLAICRGMQLLNVALGGTLIQDLPTQRPDGARHTQSSRRRERVHEVHIEPGCRLQAAIGGTHVRANSLHHQAPDAVAPPLRVVARADDGIIEGLEFDGAWWAVGVQWHPEELHATAEPWDARLFRSFVEASARPAAAAGPAGRRRGT